MTRGGGRQGGRAHEGGGQDTGGGQSADRGENGHEVPLHKGVVRIRRPVGRTPTPCGPHPGRHGGRAGVITDIRDFCNSRL
ncbi:hypothetical protein GCM10010422_62580 [Streptomyces graminearus]|uniref:Uncharacterized protein n=1 Tax=Streptomyces graminearus TaxID=284030 RepID=A0ABN3ML67_9ACTN